MKAKIFFIAEEEKLVIWTEEGHEIKIDCNHDKAAEIMAFATGNYLETLGSGRPAVFEEVEIDISFGEKGET